MRILPTAQINEYSLVRGDTIEGIEHLSSLIEHLDRSLAMVAAVSNFIKFNSSDIAITEDSQYSTMRSVTPPTSPSPNTPVKKAVSIDERNANGRPLFSQLFGGSGKNKRQTRIGSDDELLKKNRRQVDNYLRRAGALMGKSISLNDDGMAFFSYKKFVVVVEVPMESSQIVYIYTMVCRVTGTDNLIAVLKKAMELNYMEYRTRGATLGFEGEEINLCYSVPVSGLTFASLKTSIENFLLTASEVNEQLDAVKKTLPLTPSSTPEKRSISTVSYFR